MTGREVRTSPRVLSYAEAVREAVHEEMERDPSVVVLGLGVNDHQRIYGTTAGLVEAFGRDRVIETPLSEEGMTGIAIGAALAGLRPIHVHIRMDFLLLAMNQLINMAAKMRYMSGGAIGVPLVVRAIVGRSWGQGAQHSQALHALFMHIPGIKVVAPTTPRDAKACLQASVRDPDPVLFIEHRLLHRVEGVVPRHDEVNAHGSVTVVPGRDITVVGISHMVHECVRADQLLRAVGVEAEIIDMRWLTPLDTRALIDSVRRTGRLLIVDNAWLRCGASSEITAAVVEALGGVQEVQIQRLGFAPVPCPTTPTLEHHFYPNAQTIAATAHRMVAGQARWDPGHDQSPELAAFRGPF